MKLLDYTLIGLLAGMASPAVAQDDAAATASPDQAPTVEADCTDSGCTSAEGLLFRLRTRSFDQPVTEGANSQSGSRALQPDRRVAIGLDEPGKATIQGKFAIDLPGGGVIWATEDPTLGQPELSISASSFVPFDGTRITQPVQFQVRSNYPDFITRYELTVYRGSDADLVSPVAIVPIAVTALSRGEWDGNLSDRGPMRAGDELVYVLRAYDEAGNFDETYPRSFQLVRPEEAERGISRLRDGAEKAQGSRLSVEQALSQSLVDGVFATNGLRQQNIPIHGSRVRLQGRNLPAGHSLSINGESYPVDLERKFVAEYLVPVGRHSFDIAVGGSNVAEPVLHTLEVEVTGEYFFAVALADITVFENRISGSSAPFAVDQRQDDILSDGRLAFYGKAKLQGKYLVTAQADTQERDVRDLFKGFTRADPQDIFRRLDPDMYYPVYGDDSTTYRDVDTMGRLYLRVDWDQNQALWGNYQTGFAGTEFGQYQRSLYGAALRWRTRAANAWGDPGTELRVFGSEAQTAPGHSEFIGTGGSLYYLRHTDILPGSDQVVLEIRDASTGRVENRVVLLRGADYELDEMQGRILLTRPLAMVTRENLRTITRDTPLDGYEQRLIVDYEWLPTDFDPDEVSAGFRGKHWFGDHLGVGATYVQENRAGQDYILAAGDVTLRLGKGTYLKAEYAQTESFSAPLFFSDNGGLSFTQLNPVGPREGEARSLEARVNFKELGWTEQDWAAGAWWRKIGAGYSVSRFDNGLDVEESGAELLGQFSDSIGLYARVSRAERGGEALNQAQVNGEWRISDFSTLTAELRRVEEERSSGDVAGTLVALKYSHRFGTSLDVYGIAQFTLDDDGGAYADNDAFTLGAKYLFSNQSTVAAEASTGDRGDAATVSAEYKLDPNHSFYGSTTYSTDSTEYNALFNPARQNGWTLGQRWRLSNQVNLFNESQFLKGRNETGLAHTFGMDFFPAVGWNLGFTLSDGELTNRLGGLVDRHAISVHGGRTSPDTDWQSRLEWRRDSGAERRTQWVSSNRLMHKLNESWRIAARLNYADTKDSLDSSAGARFIESNLGFAYRPWNSQRWGLFGRYTYLYDLATPGQLGGAQVDQKSQIVSFEGVYKANAQWEFAGKLARREGEVRFGRGTGDWFDSATTFAAGQVRYDLRQKWHALAEYRWLDVKDGGTRQGFLVGVDRDVTRHLRLGVGYNFTDFSDDLTNFDNDHKGWFLSLVGSY